jgi:hypothetical protein
MIILSCIKTARVTVIIITLLILVNMPLARAATGIDAGMATGGTLLWMDDNQLNYRMNDMNNLGIKWIRVDFDWSQIQPDNSRSYKWSPYDKVVKAANKHHLKILAMLAYTPPWARSKQCARLNPDEQYGQKCSPKDPQEFGRFAGTVVARYKSQGLHAWEIWNEPNLTGYWKAIDKNNKAFVDPNGYARTANVAAREILRNDKASFIITGGLSPMFSPKDKNGMRQSYYLAKLLPKLDSRLFNGVGIHPYSWPDLPTKVANYNAFYNVDKGRPEYNLRTVIAHKGWGNKQIWATEFGASTTGTRLDTYPSLRRLIRPDHVTETKQAQIIKQGVDGWHDKPNVGPIFVYADSDQWLENHKNEKGYGLRRSNGTKKPAYTALQKSVRNLTKKP